MQQDHRLPDNTRERYGPWALIAGGSEGTGEAFARLLASLGLNLVLLARREQPLRTLKESLESAHRIKVRTLAIDLTDADALPRVKSVTNDVEVGLLIYNLGSNVHYGRFTEWPRETLDFMIRMNCEMPVQLSHHFAQGMKRRGRGGIVFLGSMASMAGAAYMSIYPASKAYLHILAEGLWHDLMPLGIDVMCSILGATKTPSHKHMNFDELPNDDEQTPSANMAMTCEDVAVETLQQLGKLPTWVVGEHNRALLPPDFLANRPLLVEMMSMNTANIAGIAHTPVANSKLTVDD